jgi:predicted KAP-like P-loop ATPase
MEILGDQPLSIADGDKLNRTQFAENLARAMLSWKSAESVCLALHGPWGAGKTSIINICLQHIGRIATELPEYQRPIIMKFQPWIISEQAGLTKAFLQQLRVALNQPNLSEYARQAAGILGKYEKALGYVKLLPGAAEYVGQIAELLGNLKGMAETFASDADSDLEAIKESLRGILAELPAPIIIIIDDMDRLPPHEIRQIFQLVKAVADFPKTIYLLAYDPFRVNEALKEFNPDGEGTYVEKIVQLDFEVPQPRHSKVAAYLWAELKNITDDMKLEKYDDHRWNDAKFGCLPYLFKNIREVKRYVNMVNFKYPLIKGEVNLPDVLFLEAIRMSAPKVYMAIKDGKEFLMMDSTIAFMGERHRDSGLKKEWIKRLPLLAPEKHRIYIEGLLKHLFPEVEQVIDNRGYAEGFRGYWRKAQRVCFKPYFNYYFDVALAEGEVSRQETNNVLGVINDVNALQAIFVLYVNDNRITNLLDSLELLLDETIKPEWAGNIMHALSETVENMPPRLPGMMETPFFWHLSGHCYRLLRRLPADVRKNTMEEFLRTVPKATSLPIDIVQLLCLEWDKDESDEHNKNSKKDNTLLSEETAELKQSALCLIRDRSDEDLLRTSNLASVLYNWECWSSNEEVACWVDKVLSDKRNIPQLLLGFGDSSSTGSLDSHYSVTSFAINPNSLKAFCDVEQLRIRCQEIVDTAPDWLGKNEKVIIEIFLKGFLSKWPT